MGPHDEPLKVTLTFKEEEEIKRLKQKAKGTNR